MSKKIVHSELAPAPIGPYSQAVKTSQGLVFVSGQIPVDSGTGEIVTGGIEAQARQVFANLGHILTAAGGSFEHVVKVTVFLRDLSTFAEVNQIYAEYFAEDAAPARATVEVSRLPKDVDIEIELIAAV